MSAALRWFAAGAALGLAGCSSPAKTFSSAALGTVPCSCAAVGEHCDSVRGCCAALSCQGGVCGPAQPSACAGLGQVCGPDLPCCVPPPSGPPVKGALAPLPGCRTFDAGYSICYIGGRIGSPCGDGQWGCDNGLSCINGACADAVTGQNCPSSRPGGECVQDDDCLARLQATFVDPCVPWGLVCVQSYSSYTCQRPRVEAPPFFPADAVAGDYSLCKSGKVACMPLAGDGAPVTCGSYFSTAQGQSVGMCVEQCQTAADCGSPAWDCVANQCVTNYCFAQDTQGINIARQITTTQVNPVTNDVSVLYQPCAHGGPGSYCLPTNDNNWQTTVGICYRLGGPDAGAVGAACDPARIAAGGLCQPGTFCLKGSCVPWCDLDGLFNCQDPSQQCIPVGGAIVNSSSNAFGLGACVQSCDPYQDASHNTCAAAACGMPTSVCKPNGTDVDFPNPGLCVGGRAVALAVGHPCTPFGWQDECESGAICARGADGVSFACAQFCDPQPSPNYPNPPACPSGTACKALKPPDCVEFTNRANGYACYHAGTCQ